MLLAALRYLTATLNLLLATALIAALCMGISFSRGSIFPEEIAGLVWMFAGSLTALVASIYLVLPRMLGTGLRWHTRVVLLWLMNGAVYTLITGVGASRWGHGDYAFFIQWDVMALFAAWALLWAIPGWLIATLARRNPNAA